MDKKRFSIFIAIVVIIIAIICIFVFKPKTDKNGNDTGAQQTYTTHTSDEWKAAAKKFYESVNGTYPEYVKLFTDDKDLMIIEFLESEEVNADFYERYVLDYRTGIGHDLRGNPVTLILN